MATIILLKPFMPSAVGSKDTGPPPQGKFRFLNPPSLAGFRKVLDGAMNQLRSSGLGVCAKQAEPITVEEEGLLWAKETLGNHSPQALVDTLFFLCGLHFEL